MIRCTVIKHGGNTEWIGQCGAVQIWLISFAILVVFIFVLGVLFLLDYKEKRRERVRKMNRLERKVKHLERNSGDEK